MLVIAVVGARNLWQRWQTGPVSDSLMLFLSRALALPVAAAAAWIAYIRPEPGFLLVVAFDIVFAGCVIPLFFGVYWPRATQAGAIASIATGTIARRSAISPCLHSGPDWTLCCLHGERHQFLYRQSAYTTTAKRTVPKNCYAKRLYPDRHQSCACSRRSRLRRAGQAASASAAAGGEGSSETDGLISPMPYFPCRCSRLDHRFSDGVWVSNKPKNSISKLDAKTNQSWRRSQSAKSLQRHRLWISAASGLPTAATTPSHEWTTKKQR
jgi:hypothetical protein